ncbi:hypothetical protein [Amycolatopsis anabasis]|uniref:hypothetical protein n=1 Tax=Amycolatopsis anabasis TaxID=1840409 RepID=UPI00131B8DE4|nr:hypothetical protein [Amycolatopsis anabasis]
MAVTTGYVQRLTSLSGPITCAWVGADPATNELLTISSPANEPEVDRAHKHVLTELLAQALTSGRLVEVTHPDDSATITGVALPAGNTAAQPVQLDGLEVTQAVQDLAHSVPLIAGKRTVVRAYLSNYGNAPLTVSGQLSVRTGPNAAPVLVNSANTVTLVPADAGNITVTRNDAARSLNFVLPASTTVAGQLAVRLAKVTNTANNAVLPVGNESRPIVAFQPSAPLRVRIVRISYQQGNPPVNFAPSNLDFNLLVSWLRRAYPVGQVLSSQTSVAATAAVPFGCGDINAQISAIRAVDVNAGTDKRTHYYGLVSDGGFFMRGCAAGIPGNPDPSVVASGPTGPSNWGWDFDGSYGDWYGGHELGHTFGRLHPGFCGETQDDLNNYPFPAGQLSTADSGFGGFDVGDPGNGLPLAALPGTQWHDVMTYCNRQWLSVYTYEGIRRRLLAEDALPAGAAPGIPAPAMAAGRPDERDPHRAGAAVRAAAGGTPAEPTAVSVVAQVNLTRQLGKVSFVNPVPNLETAEPEPESPVVLRIATADGRTLAEHPAPVQLNSELGPDDDRVGIVDTIVPAGPGAAVIELVIDGAVADTFRAGGTPPAARAVRAVPAGPDALGIAADLARPAETGHTFVVQVSTDRGRNWQTVGVGLPEPTVTVDRSQFPPGQEIQVRVTATNGFTSSVLTSESFRA